VLLSAWLAHAGAHAQDPQPAANTEKTNVEEKPKPTDEESAFTLVVGFSGGELARVSHPRLDLWIGAAVGFVDFGVYVETLKVSLKRQEDLAPWIEEASDRKATGLGLGAQLGLHAWLPIKGEIALRLGVAGRAGRAGFEALTDEAQTISINGYTGEIFASIGVGNANNRFYAQRWAVLVLFGYSGTGVNSIVTPSGVHTMRSTTQTPFIGLGFELGYNVPIEL
jgi:hypothetical protein